MSGTVQQASARQAPSDGSFPGVARLDADAGRFQHWFFVFLCSYLGLNFLLRLLLSPSLELDEAEQMVLTQSLELGYGEQPPLYTWLQWLAFKALGLGVTAIAVLKYALLALLYTCTFLSARRMLHDGRVAALAAFSLLLIPSFAWEALRDLTHSVLVAAMAALTLYATVRVWQEARTRDYALLGLALGLGALSKYSYALFAGALALAALTLPMGRRRFFDPRMLVGVGVAAAALAPHLAWLWEHWTETMRFVKEEARVTQSGIAAWGHGGASVLTNAAAFLSPLWLVWLMLFPQGYRRRGAAAQPGEARTLLPRYFLALAFLVALMIMAFGVTRFQERWLQPLLFLLPIFFFGRIPGVALQARRLKRYARILIVVALLVMAGRAGQMWLGPQFGSHTRLHIPWAALAAQLRAAGFQDGTIVASEGLIAGNLRLQFPGVRVVSTQSAEYVPPARGGQCLIAWDAGRGESLPPALAQRLNAERLALASVQYASAELIPDGERYVLGYMLLAGAGDCR